MRRTPAYQPVPPCEMPPARTVRVPDRGEFFLRDTALAAGAAGPTGAGKVRDPERDKSSQPATADPRPAAAGKVRDPERDKSSQLRTADAGTPDAGTADAVGTADAGTATARPPVLLLHGWVVSADLNWHRAYGALADAGHRVLALDHRGHGRGLRSPAPFRLADCAADAAAVLRALEVPRVIAVGYSMGGTIAQLLARDHPELVAGVVYSATCQHFQDPETVRTWRWMGVMGVAIGLAPRTFYRAGLRRAGLKPGPEGSWTIGELMRHEARAVAEAGRELGRFDSRPWLRELDVPAAMVLTASDTAVSPAKQRELADAARAEPVIEVALDHLDVTARADVYNPALLRAVAALTPDVA